MGSTDRRTDKHQRSAARRGGGTHRHLAQGRDTECHRMHADVGEGDVAEATIVGCRDARAGEHLVQPCHRAGVVRLTKQACSGGHAIPQCGDIRSAEIRDGIIHDHRIHLSQRSL